MASLRSVGKYNATWKAVAGHCNLTFSQVNVRLDQNYHSVQWRRYSFRGKGLQPVQNANVHSFEI
jgi:hypothetical protein